MAEIRLTKGQVAIIDDADHERIAASSWYAQPRNSARVFGSFYAMRRASRKTGHGMISMHREVVGLRPESREEVDHINGDTLDNRRANLRIVTRSQNGQNRPAQRNNRCGYKGVTQRRPGRWFARICVRRKIVYLGTFRSAELAAAAYNDAAKQYHGEFAVLNTIGAIL